MFGITLQPGRGNEIGVVVGSWVGEERPFTPRQLLVHCARSRKNRLPVASTVTLFVVPSSIGVDPAPVQLVVARFEFFSRTNPGEGEGQERTTCWPKRAMVNSGRGISSLITQKSLAPYWGLVLLPDTGDEEYPPRIMPPSWVSWRAYK